VEATIAFLRGPLFALCFGIMILGLLRLVVIQTVMLIGGKGRRLRQAPWRSILRDSVTWAVPLPHLIRGTIPFSVASFVLHIGVILIPVFLAEHAALWRDLLSISIPSFGRSVADALTLSTLICLGILFAFRTFVPRQRTVSRPLDYLLLLAIATPFASGFMASHPSVNPVPWEWMMVVHLLSSELLFLLVPVTKLAHVVLYPFDRISSIHWQLRPGAGDRVAEALFGDQARV
jgi:nitrate reductase gamma subunit